MWTDGRISRPVLLGQLEGIKIKQGNKQCRESKFILRGRNFFPHREGAEDWPKGG